MATTLAERMQWILDNRTQKGGAKWDAKTLSVEAGLSPSHIGQILRGETTKPRLDTLLKIAEAGHVSASWFASGKGHPDGDDVAAVTRSESEVPVHGNAVGFAEVLDEDQREHPEVGQRWWDAAQASASFLLHGPALPGDAYRLAKLAEELSDPTRLAKVLRESQRRVRELEAQQPDKAAEHRSKVEGRGPKRG